MSPNINYNRYLRIDELLSLQEPESDPPEHDETLFIIIHQVYELWFKELLHELDELVDHLDANQLPEGGHQLKRVLTIFDVLLAQIDVLETMTPMEFLSFRSFLANSSGFQSAQFRELEFVLGLKNNEAKERFADNEREHGNLCRRWEAPTLWDAVLRYIDRQGHSMPSDIINRDVTELLWESEPVQEALIDIYRNDPSLTPLLEGLLDLDEALQTWRFRHVMMVQRTIGTKRGTGGSDGVEYLKTTLFRPAFPDLWNIRTQL